MTSTFLSQAKAALRSLQRSQQQRDRQEGAARTRFQGARDEYEMALALAAATEGRAWKVLLDVPGMTVRTAAALGGVSVATVHRRVKQARDV
jgi:DNA-directed RNA polymerase specialized sigma24 family protein